MSSRLCFAILLAYAVALLIFTQGGCGDALRDAAGDLQPQGTIVNVLPGGGDSPTQSCDDCPASAPIRAIYSKDLGADWALGLLADGGCSAFSEALAVQVYFRYLDSAGAWQRWAPTDWPLDPTPDLCLGDLPVWTGLAHPCAGPAWCGLAPADALLEVWILWPENVFDQFFAHPGDTGGVTL